MGLKKGLQPRKLKSFNVDYMIGDREEGSVTVKAITKSGAMGKVRKEILKNFDSDLSLRAIKLKRGK